MKQLLITELLKPLSRRVGTGAAVWLMAQGVESDLSGQIASAVMAVALIVVDLAGSHVNRWVTK